MIHHLIHFIETDLQILNIETEAHGRCNLYQFFYIHKPVFVSVEYLESVPKNIHLRC